MNIVLIYKILENKIFFAILSIFIGFSIWTKISQLVDITLFLKLPICFYNSENLLITQDPDEISLCIKGPKSIVKELNTKNLAAHIDLKTLKLGENRLRLSKKNFFLPKNVKILQVQPTFIKINLNTNNSTLTNIINQ